MMKLFKIILLALSVIALTLPAEAGVGLNYSAMVKDKTPKGESSGAVSKGMVILQPDFNLGSHGGLRRGYDDFVLGFTFNADFGVHEYISVGPYLGFGGAGGDRQFAVGARGVFHWWQLLDNKAGKDLKSNKIDFYLPLHLGVHVFSHRHINGSGRYRDASFGTGVGLGFRYYFSPAFGVNLEWGWQEMSFAKIGVQFKL
jgi:hypothetical protein